MTEGEMSVSHSRTEKRKEPLKIRPYPATLKQNQHPFETATTPPCGGIASQNVFPNCSNSFKSAFTKVVPVQKREIFVQNEDLTASVTFEQPRASGASRRPDCISYI